MKPKRLIFVLVLSLALNVAVLATVGYHYYFGPSQKSLAPCPMSPGEGHFYQSLGLSQDQLTRMDSLAREFHGRLAELGAAMEGKKGLLVDLLAEDGDPAGVETLRSEMAGIQDGIQKEVISHIIETRQLLDAGQRQRFFAQMKQSMAGEKGPWFSSKGGR
jgi:hypothetical protein